MMHGTKNGFTLIELLVALFVFALLAVTAFRGLEAVTETRAHVDRETRKWQALERFFARLDGEAAQVLLRPVRTTNGAEAPALVGSASPTGTLEDVQLAFTHSGGSDAQGVLRLGCCSVTPPPLYWGGKSLSLVDCKSMGLHSSFPTLNRPSGTSFGECSRYRLIAFFSIFIPYSARF